MKEGKIRYMPKHLKPIEASRHDRMIEESKIRKAERLEKKINRLMDEYNELVREDYGEI